MGEHEEQLTVAQMSAATGVSAHTLRYYERAGLIRPVARNAGRHRRYSGADIAWVEFLLRLRETGMPIAQMRQYAGLRAEGAATTQARLLLLEAHQAELREQIAQLLLLEAHQAELREQIARLSSHEQALTSKIATYRRTLADPQRSGEHHD